MNRTVAVVGCGKAKRDGWHKARNLYTSNYFEKKRTFAEVVCDDWFILSAKHGLTDPNRRIESYDTNVDMVDTAGFRTKLEKQIEAHGDVFTTDTRVVLLAGSAYTDVAWPVFEDHGVAVDTPFDDTAGIGDQMSVVDDMTPQPTPHDHRKQAAYRATVDVYSVGVGNGVSLRYYWPFKLVHSGNIAKDPDKALRTRRTCDVLMVDSDVMNPDVTNEEVLDAADRADADFVIPKDFIHLPGEPDHPDSNEEARRKTTESVREFLEIYPDHDFGGDYLIPLQPPHDKHLRDAGFEDEDRFLVGGVKDEDPPEQLDYLKTLRSEVGPEAYIHGLGMGGSRRLIDEFRSTPVLVDSVDTSTPEFAPARHRTPDMTLRQKTGGFELPGGKDTSTGKAIAAELICWQIAHMLNADWEPKTDAEQAGVDQFI